MRRIWLEKKLGESYEYVHEWLDAMAHVEEGMIDLNHRRHRHHQEGVEWLARVECLSCRMARSWALFLCRVSSLQMTVSRLKWLAPGMWLAPPECLT